MKFSFRKLIYGFSCSLLCLITFASQAQVENPVTFNSSADAYVIKDSRIDLLIQKQRYLNTLALKNIMGYRVQVISTSNRAAANDARAKLMRLFPQYSTHLEYQSPYFRVRVGDFLQKDSAHALQEELEPYFPNGVFTIRDRIDIDPKELLYQFKKKHGTQD